MTGGGEVASSLVVGEEGDGDGERRAVWNGLIRLGALPPVVIIAGCLWLDTYIAKKIC